MSRQKKRADKRSADQEPNLTDTNRGWKARRRQFIIVSIIVSVFIALISITVWTIHYFSLDQTNLRLTVITVDDTTIKMRHFLKRTQLAGADPMVMLETLTKEQIIKLDAPQYVKEASPEDIDQALRRIARGESETISEDEFREWYRQQLNEAQLSDSEFREFVANGILGARLHQYLAERVPTVAEQVHLHAIALETYEDAEKIRARLEAGEGFAELAREVSLDPQSGEKGGNLGWFPRGVLDYRFDYVAFSLSSGEVSEPVPLVIESATGATGASAPQTYYYLLMVSEKAAAREVDEQYLPVLQAKVLDDWLLERMNFHEIKYNFNSEIYAWMNWQLAKMAGKEGEE